MNVDMNGQPEEYKKAVDRCVSHLTGRIPFTPDVCLMLGTGLGGIAGAMDVAWSSPYRDIPGFPVSTAPEHAGKLLIGTMGGTRVALFQGRFHYYEGYSARRLTLPVRVMASLGTGIMIACNAAGGLNLDFCSGDLMLIKDHINLIPDNPLRGANVEGWGPRFPDMSCAYDRGLRKIALEAAANRGIDLKEGVFVAVPGPSLETPAETRFLRMAGADAVAMSLVPEVIVAVHSGMKILGISVIANVNNPDAFEPILIEDVVAQARKAEKRLEELLASVIVSLNSPA